MLFNLKLNDTGGRVRKEVFEFLSIHCRELSVKLLYPMKWYQKMLRKRSRVEMAGKERAMRLTWGETMSQ